MISQLAVAETPQWMLDAQPVFNLRTVLEKSVFYPACWFDGTPVKYLSQHFSSFVYVDYHRTEADFDRDLKENPCKEYVVVSDVSISREELDPTGWTMPPLETCDGTFDTTDWDSNSEHPWFARWLVFHRRRLRGPKRFSLLYLCGEGVMAFHSLYVRNRIAPSVLCLICPGENWTTFADPNQVLARTLRSNPQAAPEYLLWGGFGPNDPRHKTPCWPEFSQKVAGVKPGLRLWRKPIPSFRSQ